MSKHAAPEPTAAPQGMHWVAFHTLLHSSPGHASQEEALRWLFDRISDDEWTTAVAHQGRHDAASVGLSSNKSEVDMMAALEFFYGPRFESSRHPIVGFGDPDNPTVFVQQMTRYAAPESGR